MKISDKKKRIWIRKSYYWAVTIIAQPFLIVIVSGLLLQVKEQITFIEPATQKASQKEMLIVSWGSNLGEYSIY